MFALTFSLYEVQEGGSPLWSESQKVRTDDQGRYTVLLGAASREFDEGERVPKNRSVPQTA